MKKLLLIFGSLFLFATTVLLSQTSGYKVSGTINIGGEGRWDYTAVEVPMHKLYVSHGTRVHVIDLNTNKIIGEIQNLNGVHGIAFADELGKGFISNGMNDTVTVFDLKTFKTIGNVHVTGKNPDAIVYDPFSNRVFTMNGRSSNVTAIDAKTDKVVGTIALDGRPEFAVSNGKGLVYVNLEDKSQVEEFNPKTLKTVKTWSLAPGEGPSGMAIDAKHNILFSGCHNKLMAIVNAKSGKVITTLLIGGRVDACGFDPETNLAFSSNGEGTLTVIHEVSPSEFKVVDNVPTQKGLRTMALDPVTHNVYLIGMLEGKDNTKSFGVLILEKK
ncbi:MAG: YncE family protein [Bacteroidetes bacterium]|nr:YncE family protein [Bacteroidota bacterium]